MMALNDNDGSRDQESLSLFDNLRGSLPPLMGINEVAKTFNVSRTTINRLRRQGHLKCVKFGNDSKSRVLIVTEHLLRFLERSQ